MSPLNIERLESVCVTYIQHQKYRKLSASVVVTINSSFFSVYGTHCTLSSDSSILFIVIRFVNFRILSSLSQHFEIFSYVLPTPVVSIIHISLIIIEGSSRLISPNLRLHFPASLKLSDRETLIQILRHTIIVCMIISESGSSGNPSWWIRRPSCLEREHMHMIWL